MVPSMRRSVLLAALASAVVAAAAPSAGAQSTTVPNGAYYGVYFPTTTIVAMSVRNNDIGATTIFSQNFNPPFSGGLPQSFLAGANNTVLTNPGTEGQISRSGTFSISAGASLEDFFSPSVCGQTHNGYLVASLQCSPTGITPGTNAMFSLRPATLQIAPGTYTGSVNSTPSEPGQPSNPSVPWTGTTGTVSLTVAGGTITGSASLSPVNPQTGVPVAGPPVNATYGPVSIASAAGVDEMSGGASTATGLFALPSTPGGYSLCGGFLTNGLVIGVSPCGGQPGIGANAASYVASTFVASSGSS
jgi:hypothetical protein